MKKGAGVMARPTNKEQLLKSSEENYQKMKMIIEGLTKEEQEGEFPFEDRDRRVRDILIHLYEWHQLLLNWERDNLVGKRHDFLPEDYNWKNYPEMNVKFFEKHQATGLVAAKEMLEKSHKEVKKMIEKHSNEELFTKKYYDWTGTTSLGAYAVSATSSHYDWAIKKLKRYVKALSEK